MVEAGQRAPDFTLVAQDGNQVSLAGYAEHTVVVYSYTRADTPG